MKDIMKDFSRMKANMFLDDKGGYFGVNMIQLLPEEIKDYVILNYYLFFDAKHRNNAYYE